MGKNGILIKNPDKIKITVELEKLMTNNNLRKCLEKSSWSNFTFSAKRSSKILDKYREKILLTKFIDQ